MIFHITRAKHAALRQGNGDRQTHCGLDLDEVYRTLDQSLGTEAQLEFRQHWFPGDSVCLDCVKRARPSTPKQILACRNVKRGEWVVLCGCGCVRPHGAACGNTKPLPCDRQEP